MSFVIRRSNDSKYVTNPGSQSSYTAFLQYARIFPSQEEAERNRCVENEYVEEVRL